MQILQSFSWILNWFLILLLYVWTLCFHSTCQKDDNKKNYGLFNLLLGNYNKHQYMWLFRWYYLQKIGLYIIAHLLNLYGLHPLCLSLSFLSLLIILSLLFRCYFFEKIKIIHIIHICIFAQSICLYIPLFHLAFHGFFFSIKIARDSTFFHLQFSFPMGSKT